MVAGTARGRRGRAVGQGVPEVLGLEHLAELRGTPLGHEELQAGLGAQPPVAVVAEDRDDAEPHVGGLLGRDEHAEPLGQARGGGQPATDPEVVAGAELGVDDPDERDVVDLVHDVEARVPGDGRLELARQVGELRVADEPAGDLVDRGRGVEDLVGGDAGERAAEDDARGVTARLGGLQADGLEAAPDLGHVLDPDPVVLDVLPVADVGRAAGELVAEVGEHPQLGQGEGATVEPHPQHEVLVGELGVVELRGAAAVDAGLALGVEPPPAEPAAEVLGRDGGEPLLGVDLLDALAHVEAAVLLLPRLVGVERLGAVDGPLTVGTAGPRRAQRPPGRGLGRWRGHGSPSRFDSGSSLIKCITLDYSSSGRSTMRSQLLPVRWEVRGRAVSHVRTRV